jgi:hypothetical protein
MRALDLTLLFSLALSLFAQTAPARAGGLEMIDISSLNDPLGPLPRQEDLSAIMAPMSRVLNQAYTALGIGARLDRSGVGGANLFANRVSQYALRLWDTNAQIQVEGVGNLRFLGEDYYFADYQGGIGIQYNFAGIDNPDRRLVLRFSPLYAEVGYIKVRGPNAPDEELPLAIMLGSALSFEAEQQFGPVRGGFSVTVRPGVEIAQGHGDFGLSHSETVYLRIPLDVMATGHGNPTSSPFEIVASVTYADRGEAFNSLYDWESDRLGSRRSGNALFEGSIRLQWTF